MQMMQTELFQELQAESRDRRFRPPLFPQRFLRVRVAYEDLIFAFLSLILVLLAGFCLGVERGKRLVKEPPVVSLPASTVSMSDPSEAKVSEPLFNPGGQYAVQLASYLDRQAAQMEADRLRRKGFNAQVVKQGKYYELRVAGYRSRTEAMGSLAGLKKIYHDGFVKHLSSG